MGYPRHVQVPPGEHGVWHCSSRCVRRAFLCGEDAATGRSFEHRRQWLEERILELGSIFAVAVHAYAVMSNHVHVVVEVDPNAAEAWSDEEVASRWLELSRKRATDEVEHQRRIEDLAAKRGRIVELRERLGSLSWFNRYLKEPIARRANAEDGCTGRFWEGRFDSKTLLDDDAVLCNMVYVDLNPVRAGLAETPQSSDHTSVRTRLAQLAEDPGGGAHPMRPVAQGIRSAIPELTSAEYLDLVEWTGRILHHAKRGAMSADTPSVFARLGLHTERWLRQVPQSESGYCRAVGSVDSLIAWAERTGRRWIRGIGTARRLERGAQAPAEPA